MFFYYYIEDLWYEFLYYFDTVVRFIMKNKIVFSCFIVPLVTSCILIVIDFIFDVRDEFTDFNKFKDNFNFKYKYFYSKRRKQHELDMNAVYQKSKENSDYKHRLKMEELRTFKENEEIRHQHKHEENEMFLNRKSVPKHNKQDNSTLGKRVNDVNLDIEVED